jgi:FLVCR family feline leukemia virus subgroup C receptor-related protein
MADKTSELGAGPLGGRLPTKMPTDALLKPTPKRWIILALFCLNSGNKAFQWIQVPAVTTKATIFYGVDNYVINFASIIFMLAFLVMSWPACFIIDKIGIRNAVVSASVGASVGSIVKCFSCHSSYNVALLLFGQTMVSLSEQLIFSVPSRLVSVWFPDQQVSFAMAVCILGNQLGIAIGFILPQWLLDGAESAEQIGHGFSWMYFWTAVLSLALFTLNYLLFDEAPVHAPGEARFRQLEMERQQVAAGLVGHADTSVAKKVQTMLAQVMRLFKNRDLMLVAVSYGIAFGRGDTISTLLDQTMGPIYPDGGQVIGTTGFLIVAAGALGLPLWGRILDAWHAYKTVNTILAALTSLALACLTCATIYLKWIPGVYLSAIVFGFFQTGFLVAGLELAIELTYPAPELITSSLLNIMPSIAGPVFIVIGSFIVDNFGPLATNVFYLTTLLVGFICISCVNERLGRQEAIKLNRMEKQISNEANTCY